MNQVFVIKPYIAHGTWVFDDPNVGLEQEPFVSGIPQMIDRLVEDIPNAEHGFRLLFSSDPFPGSLGFFEHVREELGGHWYRSPELDAEGWLCPAMFEYFDAPPAQIHVRAESIEQDQKPDGSTDRTHVTRDELDDFEKALNTRDYDMMKQMIEAIRVRMDKGNNQ